MIMPHAASSSDEEIHGINVTPLVDIMLVLLLIFMITTVLDQPGSLVTTVGRADPLNGWYNLRHDGVTGWSYGPYLRFVSAPSSGGSGLR